jgi:carboxypeptidase Taq
MKGLKRMDHEQAYNNLLEHGLEIARLNSIIQVLGWDQRTCIPTKGHGHRSEQMAYLAKLRHRRMTDPRAEEWLSEVEKSELVSDPDSIPAVNIRYWRRGYDKIRKIPESLAVELARLTSETQSVWERARPENDWAGVSGKLKRLFDLKIEQAQALGYEESPYDPLLDGYELDETVSSLQPVFDKLTPRLSALLDRILKARPPKSATLDGAKFPIPDQEKFGKYVAAAIGYDLEAGRLDISAHPFTTGIGPGDTRITTRYSETDFKEAFFATVHETGHALYHQGLPIEHWGAPFCRAVSLGINESQSRMWENMVARSRGFWEYFKAPAAYYFRSFDEIGMEDLLREFNRVDPGFIRVEADEVTYNLHILLRFKLEQSLISGELEVEDLPEAWNREFEELFHMTPPDYAQGVMQDVHWFGGAVGYFPTYTLGNLYAAQFAARAETDLGDWEPLFREGRFLDLLAWLREKIHSQGARYKPRELAERISGEDLNPDYFMEYLESKYSRIYDL